jgi:hypothetical protein
VISYVFRSDIRSLTSRISLLKYKDVEAKFDKELEYAEGAALIDCRKIISE